MKKATIVVHRKYVESVVKRLYETGLMEIRDISIEEPEILNEAEKADIPKEATVCMNYELRLSRLIDILDKIRPKERGIKALLNPEEPFVKEVEERSLEEICSDIEKLLSTIENRILEDEATLTKIRESREKIEREIELLQYIEDFDIDVSYLRESTYVIIKVGKTEDIEDLSEQIKQIDKAFLISKEIKKGKKVEWVVAVVAHVSEKDKIDKIWREKVVEFDLGTYSGLPNEIIKNLQAEKKEMEKKEDEIISRLVKHAKDKFYNLLALKEEIQLERIKIEVTKNFARTNSTFIIRGWILERDEEKLKENIKNVAGDYATLELQKPSLNPDKPPIHIEMPRWARGFKDLLSTFALPKYNEINPALILGIFFILFFGFMLGDAGYGILILVLSLFAYLKLKRSELIRSWAFIGIFMGIVTIIVGFLTNSFFGDLIPRFIYNDPYKPLYKIEIYGIHLPADPIKDPISILTIALILGLIHLNIGVFLGIYQSYRRKEYKEMLTYRLCWIPLQIGGGLLIGNFILGIKLSEQIFYISLALTIIGLIQLFASRGPTGFFGLTGYVGDWLSYARLLALGLATCGMALAFNIISQLLGDMIPFIGVAITVILLMITHIANLALQSLGAAVHSLRLQYVEFFNRFYEGGGEEFRPFKANRRFTKRIEKMEVSI